MRGRSEVLDALNPLIGLRLTWASNAADLKIFHFGLHPDRKRVGEYALHIQCAWRIVGPGGIVTGSADRYESAEPGKEFDTEDGADDLQAQRLRGLLGETEHETRSLMNRRAHLVVQDATADEYGAIQLVLSGGYVLQAFPDGSYCEAWRVFRPGDLTTHFVFPAEHPGLGVSGN